jgi:hypothetical protein
VTTRRICGRNKLVTWIRICRLSSMWFQSVDHGLEGGEHIYLGIAAWHPGTKGKPAVC